MCKRKLRWVCMCWMQGLVDVIEIIKAGRSGEEVDPCVERLQNLRVVSSSVALNLTLPCTESQLMCNAPDEYLRRCLATWKSAITNLHGYHSQHGWWIYTSCLSFIT